MTRLGIVVALPSEAQCLVNRRIRPGERAEVPGHGWVQLCGIGPKRARRAADSLLDAGATALLSWGMAGGLDPSLLSGNLILPEAVITPDEIEYHVDANWRTRMYRCLQGNVDSSNGPLLQAPRVVVEVRDKAALFQSSGAVAVDMESAAVATVARRACVPFMVIRAIADPAERPIPAALVNGVDAYGRLRLLELSRSVLRQPRSLAELLRIRQDVRAACTTLARVVKLTGPGLLAN